MYRFSRRSHTQKADFLSDTRCIYSPCSARANPKEMNTRDRYSPRVDECSRNSPSPSLAHRISLFNQGEQSFSRGFDAGFFPPRRREGKQVLRAIAKIWFRRVASKSKNRLASFHRDHPFSAWFIAERRYGGSGRRRRSGDETRSWKRSSEAKEKRKVIVGRRRLPEDYTSREAAVYSIWQTPIFTGCLFQPPTFSLFSTSSPLLFSI